MRAFHFRKTFGAEILDDGRTVFTLWAPSSEDVFLKIDGMQNQKMHSDGLGHFSITASCSADARYCFCVSDGQCVPDPASRSQPDGVLGASEVIDPKQYQWQHPEWQGRPWHEAVIYELHAGLLGGYDGICRQLDELAALGITAIELMPINSFGGTRNWGYDGVLPYATAVSYGHPNKLKHLIDAAHARNIMVILDVVYNHFGPVGNFLPIYADDFFDHDQHSTWGIGIHFNKPDVRDFFIENVLYWIMEYRFDGVRIDAASAISDHTWFGALQERVQTTIEPGRHVHLILENENNDAGLLRNGFTAQWNDDGHNALHVLLTGEHEGYYKMFSKDPTEDMARVLAEGFVYQGQINPYSGKNRGMPSDDLPATKFILFLQNHDQTGNRAFGERLLVLAKPEAVKAAYALLLLSPMIPMIFMGEEWGCITPFYFFCDFHGELAERIKEGRRNEFSQFSTFQDETIRKQIPDPNALSTFEASKPDRSLRDTDSGKAWLALTHHLLALRKKWIIPYLHHAQSAGVKIIGIGAICARWSLDNKKLLTIFINLSDKEYEIIEPHSLIYTVPDTRQAGVLPAFSFVASLENMP
ncbi:malto-oligosyltrehalose trehalohydrolase [Acetobacter sp. AAB5]|uniref:malto-oligosyltrehalose trehalohydrolase n=1 Tax=Acetobacter sp. AAB5 TaxID=3418370 RepID=UPI003CF92D7F